MNKIIKTVCFRVVDFDVRLWNSSPCGSKSNKFTRSFTKALTIIDGQTEWLNKVYKDIHEHPELGFMEKRTSAIVAKELKSLGFDVKTGIAKTGVVGILKMVKGQRLCTVPIWMPTLLKRQLVYHTRVKCA